MKRINRDFMYSSALFSALLCVAITLGIELRACGALLFSWGKRLSFFLPAFFLCSTLVYLLFVLLSRPRPRARMSLPRFGVTWAFFFVSALPALLAYCPGIVAYDATAQILQGINNAYTTHHPLLHTLLLSGCLRLGASLYSYTLGAGIYSLVQIALLSFLFSCICRRLAMLGASRAALWGVVVFYAFYPVNAIMAISTTKDTLFAGLVALFLLETVTLLRKGRALFVCRRDTFRYIFLAALTCLMRNNGIYALIVLALCCIAVHKGIRLRLTALFAACVLAYTGAQAALTASLQASPGSTLEMLCVPLAQMARVARYHGEELDAKTSEALEEYMPLSEENAYTPHLADPVKMSMEKDAFSRDPSAFLALWMHLGLAYPDEYLNAALLLNQGMWDPLDTSTGHIYDVWGLEQHGYLQTRFQRRIDDERGIFIEKQSFWPSLQRLYERLCTENVHQENVLFNLAFAPASALWVCAFFFFFFLAQRRRAPACASLMLFGLAITQLLGPCALTRYAYPFFTSAPVLFALSRTRNTQENENA